MRVLSATCALSLALATAAVGQEHRDPPPAGASGTQRVTVPDACETGPITYIFVDNHSIFDAADPDLDPRFSTAYRIANALHVRTRESVIRRELLIRTGDCFAPALLEESERLLRAHEFLSRVDIYGIRQPDGGYHVIVDTQDEWSTRLDLRLALEGGLAFRGARLRESNLLGTGRAVELFYTERDAERDYGIGYLTRQLLGTRWDFDAAAGRTRAGTFAFQSFAYPFVGEAGRWAARQGYRREDRLFDYVVDHGAGETRLLLPIRDKGFDLAFVGRTGEPGRLTIFGAALSFAELHYPGGAPAVTRVEGNDFDGRTPADSALVAPVLTQMNALSTVRLLLLLGQRNVSWVQRRGLDALRGEQDVRLGSEIELALGPSLPGRAGDDDLFGTITFSTAAELGDLLVAGRFQADGRRDLDPVDRASGWEDIYAGGELLAYWRPGTDARHTLVLRGAGLGGWETRTPFQLTLGGDDGVRGYARERFPGGQRLLVSLEDRIYFGWPFRDVLDLGASVFVDAGRVWPGDVPFGVDSGWRAAAGAGLRGAFPAGGRTTYRIDLALPLRAGAGWNDLRLMITVGERLGLAPRGRDTRFRDARQLGVAGEIFHFPE